MISTSFARLVGRAAALAGIGLVALSVTATPGRSETLKLGNEGIYPPFSMVAADGTLSGFEPDLAREMCVRMKVECEFVVMDFKALIPSLLQGKFDVLVSQLNPTPERQAKLLLSMPMLYNPSTFVVKKDTDYTFTKEGVTGKNLKMGLVRGGFATKYLADRYGDAFEYVFYDNPDQIRMDLLAGRIDMTFEAKINSTIELIQKPEGKDWKLAGGEHWSGDPAIPLEKRGNTWAVRKDAGPLMDRINATLVSMIEDCTYTKLRKKYFDITLLAKDAECEAKTN